jgi:hypothetical protein
MVQPTDYRIQYVDPVQAMTQGLQGAQTLQMNRQTMQVNDQAIQENQYKLAEMQRQQQQAAERKAAYDARRTELLDGANETTYLRNTLRLRSEFPEFNAGADEAVKQMGEARRQQAYQTAQQVRALLTAKKPEAARDLLQAQAVAMRNAGDEQNAKVTEALAQAMTDAPDLAPRIADEFAALTMTAKDRDEMLKAGSEIDKNRATTTKTSAEADQVAADAEAKRADMLARQDIARAQVEVARQQAAVAAANGQVAADVARANLATAQARLAEMQRQAGVQSTTAQQKQADRNAAGLTQAEGFEDMSAKVVELLADPNLDSIVGAIDGRTPNLSGGARSAAAKLDTIKSAIFLTISPTLTGTQTAQDAEDMKRAWAALDTAQDPPAFKRELRKIALRAQTNAARARKQYALPDVAAATTATAGQTATAPTASYMQLVK